MVVGQQRTNKVTTRGLLLTNNVGEKTNIVDERNNSCAAQETTVHVPCEARIFNMLILFTLCNFYSINLCILIHTLIHEYNQVVWLLNP